MHVDIGNGTIINSSSYHIEAENINDFYYEDNEINNPLSCHRYEHRHPLPEELSRKTNSAKQSSRSGSGNSRLVIDTYSPLEKYTPSTLLTFPYPQQGSTRKHRHNKTSSNSKNRKRSNCRISNNNKRIKVKQEKKLYQDKDKYTDNNCKKNILDHHNLLAYNAMTNQENSGGVAGAMRKMHTSKIINVDSTPPSSSPIVSKNENVNVKSFSPAASEQRERKSVSHVTTTSATTARANTTTAHTNKNNKNYSNNNSMYNIETTTNPNTEEKEKITVTENVNNFFIDRSVEGEVKGRKKYNEQAQLSQRSRQRWSRNGSNNNTANRTLKRRSVAVADADVKQGATRTSPDGNSRSHHDAELPGKESSKNTTNVNRDAEVHVVIVDTSNNNNCSNNNNNKDNKKKIVNMDNEDDEGGRFTVKAVRRATSEHSKKQNVEIKSYFDKEKSGESNIANDVIIPVIAGDMNGVCYNDIINNINVNKTFKNDDLDNEVEQNNKDDKLKVNQREGVNSANFEKKVDNNANDNIYNNNTKNKNNNNNSNNNNVKKVEGKPGPQLAQTKIQLGMQLKR